MYPTGHNPRHPLYSPSNYSSPYLLSCFPCPLRPKHLERGPRERAKKKEEEEEDLLGAFFYRVYEFLYTLANPPPVIHRPHIPARYAIRFVPATGAPTLSQPAFPVFVPAEPPPRHATSFVAANAVSSTDFSIVSSANFVVNARAAIPLASSVTDYSVTSSVNLAASPPVFVSSCIESNT